MDDRRNNYGQFCMFRYVNFYCVFIVALPGRMISLKKVWHYRYALLSALIIYAHVMSEVSCRVTVPIALSFIIPLGTTVVFPLWRQVMVDTNYLCVKYTLNVRVCRFTGATSAHYCIRNARFACFE